jgi:hypothetical protein
LGGEGIWLSKNRVLISTYGNSDNGKNIPALKESEAQQNQQLPLMDKLM